MKSHSQERAPIYEALQSFQKMRVVPFDVPGHKRGRGNPELTALLGEQCVKLDVNSMKPLDNLCHPVSVIREAEELAADPMVRKVYLGQHFELKKSHQLTQEMKNRKGQELQAQAASDTRTARGEQSVPAGTGAGNAPAEADEKPGTGAAPRKNG